MKVDTISENKTNKRSGTTLTKEHHYITDERQFDIAVLGQKAIASKNLLEFINEFLILVSVSLGTEYVKILKLTDDNKRLKLIYGIGWKKGTVGSAYVEVDYTSQAGYTLINKKPIIVEDFEKEDRFTPPPLLKDHDVLSGMSIAIPGLNGTFGILGVHSKRKIKFSVNDVNFFHSASHILSSKIVQQESLDILSNEEKKYRILMEYASDAILIADLDGKLLEVNAKACELTQYKKEELLGKNVSILYIPEELKENPLRIGQLPKGYNEIIERNIVRKDHSSVPVEISLTLLPNNSVQAIFRDISVRKETETYLRNFKKMEAISRLSGEIAHDFNNYLTIIHNDAEKILSSDNIQNEEALKDAQNIKKTTEKASTLIKELLSFSRRKQFQKTMVDVNNIIKELKKSLISIIGEKIELQLDLQKNLRSIKLDSDQLQQSIINLVINSKDALKEIQNSKITIKTFDYVLEKVYNNFAFNAQPGKFIAIKVIDNGSGMSEEANSHLFEPFFTTKEEKKGTGLGLASIYGFINEFGGFITVESSIGKGTSITLFLK